MEKEKKIIEYLIKTYDPESIITYGSFGDGSANENSDFDALVIAGCEKRHDDSVVDNTVLDVFVYPSDTFSSGYDPQEFEQIFDGNIVLDKYGKAGVEALEKATPKDTGTTAKSWRYVIVKEEGRYRIEFHNDNISDWANVAILIQYGHGTRNGGYVEGIDYINPALAPVFNDLASQAWEEVKRT